MPCCCLQRVHSVLELEEALTRAQSEAHKAREMSDISIAQLAAMSHAQAFAADEMHALREQARAAASSSDDSAIIGKLQRQMMETKAAYQTLSKKHEATRTALQRARLSAAVLEAAIDEKSAEVM